MDRDEIKKFYAAGVEKERLDLDLFKLEGLRTKEIVSRYLLREGLNIIDIGGGAGYYSFWLKELGHHVYLVDLSPENIEMVRAFSKQHGIHLNACEEGDATALNYPDNQFDMVLLLGPLYHLTEKEERIKAISEAKRVLKPGGILFAAIISRYASLVDGFKRNLITDDRFEKILLNDLQTGRHINNTGNMEYFTTAYFHTPAEIKKEIAESGLKLENLIAIESVGCMIDGFAERSKDEQYMTRVQRIISTIESNEDLVAMSPHIMAIASKS